jgi:hypothetical protein
VITIVDGVDHTLCSFHDELYRDLGTIRTPRGYGKARQDARLAKAQEEDEELKAAAELEESTVLDLLRARLTGLGVKTTKSVEGVIKDGLTAKKFINVTCKGCGKRSRHSIADINTRLATVKLIANELTPPEPGPVHPGAFDLSDPSITTAQLLSAANPSREYWIQKFHRSNNLASKVEWVVQIHERWKAGGIVSEKQLAEAKEALSDMQAIRRLTAPLERLSFAEEHRGPRLTPRKRDDGLTMTSPIPLP